MEAKVIKTQQENREETNSNMDLKVHTAYPNPKMLCWSTIIELTNKIYLKYKVGPGLHTKMNKIPPINYK